MGPEERRSAGISTGLSGRLLALTILFVMLAEILIYVPSISRFRKEYLEGQMAKAHLAVLAVQASPGQEIGETLAMDLLLHAGARGIILKTPERRILMLAGEMPPAVDATFDLDERSMLRWIPEAFATLWQAEARIIRIVGRSPRQPEAMLEMLLDETPLRRAMYGYSVRILTLSVIISLITAGLVYLSLQWLMVKPILRIYDNIMRFREDPEDEAATIEQSGRRDEIGLVERQLAVMQTEVRNALRQKAHLAALGTAVAKINHDLRNTLATAALASDHLTASTDPVVKRVATRVYSAIDRAVVLCSQTLEFVRDFRGSLRPAPFALGDLVAEMETLTRERRAPSGGIAKVAQRGRETIVVADRQQMFRVLSNLMLNAAQAGARHLRIEGRTYDESVIIDIADDGPGIPAASQATLFEPFSTTSRDGGLGLGLVIAKEIVSAHGGDLTLADTGPHGTTFRITLPRPREDDRAKFSRRMSDAPGRSLQQSAK